MSDTQLAVATPAALALNTLDDLQKVGTLISKSGMFGVTSEAQAVCLMLVCQAEGLNPIEALKRYHIIEGRPSRRADSILADFEASGGAVIWHARADEMVGATFFADRKSIDDPARERAKARYSLMWDLVSEDNPKERARLIGEIGKHSHEGEETIIRTLFDADEKKLSMSWDKERKEWKRKHNWNQSPRQMLTARVVTEGVRLIKPGVIAGMSTDDETRDVVESERERIFQEAFSDSQALPGNIDQLRRMYDEVQAKIATAGKGTAEGLYELRSRLQEKIENFEGEAVKAARVASEAPKQPAIVREVDPGAVTRPEASEEPTEAAKVVDATDATVERPQPVDEPPGDEEMDWRKVVVHVTKKIKDKTLGGLFDNGDVKKARELMEYFFKPGGFVEQTAKYIESHKKGATGAPHADDMALYKGLIAANDWLCSQPVTEDVK